MTRIEMYMAKVTLMKVINYLLYSFGSEVFRRDACGFQSVKLLPNFFR